MKGRHSSKSFMNDLVSRGITHAAGVPCSYLGAILNEASGRGKEFYTPASNEGEALSVAAGCWLGGGLGLVLCQNSGLGNMVSPLTSLSWPFEIPTLLLVTWRGRPGEPDEPQHELMGKITTRLLDNMEVQWSELPDEETDLTAAFDVAFKVLTEEQRPYAFVIRKGDFDEAPSPCSRQAEFDVDQLDVQKPSRMQALRTFLECVPEDAAVVATTGKCGRELYTLSDRKQHLYCVGSMGYASAVGQGLAAASARTVFVLDGDGAAIMHLGNLATIGAMACKSLTHIILDNGAYDSTGGQATVARSIEFADIAAACGYGSVISCRDLEEFKAAIKFSTPKGPRLIHLLIAPGSTEKLGRPTLSPAKTARRLRKFASLRDPVPSVEQRYSLVEA